MTTHAAAPTTETGKKRFRPYQLSIAIGIGMGTATIIERV